MRLLAIALVVVLAGCGSGIDMAKLLEREHEAQKRLDAANAELNEALRNEAFQQGNMAGTGCALAVMKRGLSVALATDPYCKLSHSEKRYDEIHEDLNRLHVK